RAASRASRAGVMPVRAVPTGVPSPSYVSVATPNRTTASYRLSPALRNRARRVARPSTSGSTPLAAGSSVPVWPIRRSPSTRRMIATTSCEVGPVGLSMTSRPSIDGPLDLFGERRLEGFDRTTHRAARGVFVTASAELLGDGADVDVAFGSHAD